MNTKQIIILISGILCVFLLAVLVKEKPLSDTASSEKLSVVASFYPLSYIAQEIGGDKIEIHTLTPAGSEPHDYEPTAGDIANVSGADLLLLNGNGLETWGKTISNIIDPKATRIITMSDEIGGKISMLPGKITAGDPHFWLSPSLMQEMTAVIAEAFAKSDEANAGYYAQNAENFRQKLTLLDEEFKQGLSNCLRQNIITSHAAFGYLAASYDLRQVSIAGLSPEEEPSPKQMSEISSFAKENNIEYIFFESLVSPKLSDTIAREIGAQTLVLNPIEGLTPDEVASGKDYMSEMRNNLKNLQIALACK